MAHPSTRLKNTHPSPRPSTSAKATADRSPGQALPPERPAQERQEQPAYRILPHNMEAEQGLLGALLVDNRAMEKIGDFLRQDHFFIPAHRRIYAAIEKLIERGQTASPVTLKGYFEKDEGLVGVGGAEYLAELAASVITVVNTEDYGRTIYDLHLRRELIALGEDMVTDAFEHSIERDANAAIEQAEARLYSLAETGQIKGGFVSLKDSVITANKNPRSKLRGIGRKGREERRSKLRGIYPERD